MWSSFVAILLKEFKHIFRDKGTLALFFTLPVIQLALSSPTLPEQSVFDAAVNQLRPQLVTLPGVAIPFLPGPTTTNQATPPLIQDCVYSIVLSRVS